MSISHFFTIFGEFKISNLYHILMKLLLNILSFRLRRSIESEDQHWAPGYVVETSYVVGTSPKVISIRKFSVDMLWRLDLL